MKWCVNILLFPVHMDAECVSAWLWFVYRFLFRFGKARPSNMFRSLAEMTLGTCRLPLMYYLCRDFRWNIIQPTVISHNALKYQQKHEAVSKCTLSRNSMLHCTCSFQWCLKQVLTWSLVTSSFERVSFSFASYNWYIILLMALWSGVSTITHRLLTCTTLPGMRSLDHHHWPLQIIFYCLLWDSYAYATFNKSAMP